jgi:hypothetical protein
MRKEGSATKSDDDKQFIWLTRNRFTATWVRDAYEAVEERRVLVMVPVTQNNGIFGIIRMDLR